MHQCQDCGKIFSRKYNFLRHVSTCNARSKPELVCMHCQKSGFKRKWNLDRHLKSCNKTKPVHRCPICSLNIARKDNYEKHLKQCQLKSDVLQVSGLECILESDFYTRPENISDCPITQLYISLASKSAGYLLPEPSADSIRSLCRKK